MLLCLQQVTAVLLLHMSVCAVTPKIHVLCRAKDSAIQLASAWRLVQVQQVYSVTMTIPLTLAADNLADAQTQADQVITGSTRSSALSSALAAGLIAGWSTAVQTLYHCIQVKKPRHTPWPLLCMMPERHHVDFSFQSKDAAVYPYAATAQLLHAALVSGWSLCLAWINAHHLLVLQTSLVLPT